MDMRPVKLKMKTKFGMGKVTTTSCDDQVNNDDNYEEDKMEEESSGSEGRDGQGSNMVDL